MTKPDNDDQGQSKNRTAARLNSILPGAFAGAPTPLKDIPTREGESRRLQRKKRPNRLLKKSLAGWD